MTKDRQARASGEGTRGQRKPARAAPLPTTARRSLSARSAFSVPLLLTNPATDHIRHAAKLARKLQMDAAMGGTPQPDAEFYKALSKALDEIAAGLEQVSRSE